MRWQPTTERCQRRPIDLVGAVAVIHPGTGGIALPPGTQAVAIDLRDLPAAPGLRAVLEAAVGSALASSISRPRRNVRTRVGLSDEIAFVTSNVYWNTTTDVVDDPIPATGAGDLPLALLTGPSLAPEAAALAATLRVAGRAWLFGDDVHTAVAEARWNGVGASGLAWRDTDLGGSLGRWPDLIPADVRSVDATSELASLPSRRAPPPVAPGRDERPRVLKVPARAPSVSQTLGHTQLLADLIIVHGTMRLFYPLFSYSGDHLDERLLETLAAAAALGEPSRRDVVGVLRRFGETIHDGHNFIVDFVEPPAGYFNVVIEQIEGQPVVRRSAVPAVNPGDAIVSIDGIPIADWYNRELKRSAGATDAARFQDATNHLLELAGPTEFGLRDPSGAVRTLGVAPEPAVPLPTLPTAPSVRAAGYLADLGAPTIYYINLDQTILSAEAAYVTQLREAQGASGLVLDVRGYPRVNFISVDQRLTAANLRWLYHIPEYSGVDRKSTRVEIDELTPAANPSWRERLAILVGPGTGSQAETLVMGLFDVGRGVVIGQPTWGTTGNLTGVKLPGGIGVSFTGMEPLHANGNPFIGIGIVPSVVVAPAIADVASGNDPELRAAIQLLSQ